MPNTNKRATDHRPANVRPVCLEVNHTGGWRRVVTFDGADKTESVAVQKAAIMLCCIGGGHWRIVSAGEMPQPLSYLHDVGTGWQPARRDA